MVEGELQAHEQGEQAEISLNVLLGLDYIPNTIKIVGNIKQIPLVILIDSGSTHSFIDHQVPKNLGQMGVPIKGLLRVRVANGHEQFCSHFSPSFMWEMRNNQFHFDLRWLQVKGCDIVLGMDWINSVAPLILHTKPHSISFMKDGRFLTLIASRDVIKIAPAKAKSIQKLLKSSYCSFLAQA